MKKSNGLLALLGLGAFAYYKYNKMSKDDKAVVKDQLNEVKRIFTDVSGALKEEAAQKINEVKGTVDSKLNKAKSELSELKDKARDEVEGLKDETENMYN